MELEDALDLIYADVNILLLDGAFTEVDELLQDLPVTALPIEHVLAFASITRSADQHLPSRKPFLAKVRKHLEEVHPSRVGELLDGLE
jgi:hypothetical protein